MSCAEKAAEAHNTCREKALDMVSDRVARMWLQAIGVSPEQPWYKGQYLPKTKKDETQGMTGSKERHLRTSVWIVRAVACITKQLYDNRSTRNAKHIMKSKSTHSDPTEAGGVQKEMDRTVTGGKNVNHRRKLSTKESTGDRVADSISEAEIEEVTTKY